ncbi:hypothetical protein M2152_002473 [Microbacteriaceae bacterium SG_E_30_P1]|uniref:LPXTG-motif cell wall anchor domain-containing protein n=1 Tax=Antiquaquibacter oligotrophicus TaxID=2880260 RepID=A0ABT6KR43_9MICO|nr:hypothetical protein [Antiquaquibacter oligotrophicus]MDH6182291.1 hypothetical protein [Antiquaquibacter oligotrophicus]UDF12053.1 hypothetical protein LH407_07700 [Antiquaquibacter oligotrophicus]
MSGNGVPIGGGLAVTGLAIPFGWYFVIGIAVLVLGFLLVRVAMRRSAKRSPRHA